MPTVQVSQPDWEGRDQCGEGPQHVFTPRISRPVIRLKDAPERCSTMWVR
jgi:hypothetical protein